ncbi:MAG: septum formation initiator family protein [Planctomycetota bacterium]
MRLITLKSSSIKRDDIAFIILVLLCAALVMIYVTVPNHNRNVRLFEKYHSLSENVKTLEKANGRIETEIKALKTDKYFIEAVARKKFLLLKQGESIVVDTK